MGFQIIKILCIIFVAFPDNNCVFAHQLETRDTVTAPLRNVTIPEPFRKFCPTSCYKNNLDFEQSYNLCCIPCDCTASCFAAGTCCLDIQTNHVHDGPKSAADDLEETCVSTAVGDTNTTATIIEIDRYLLVQLCPSRVNRNISNDVIAKCLQPDRKVFDEMIPVYSNITDRNYRNIFCAMCNEDNSSTVTWESYFTCRNQLMTMTLFPKTFERNTNKTLLQALRDMEGCILQWRPGNDRAKHCIVDDTIISRCNNPTYFSIELDGLCRGTYSPVKGFRGVYKNYFCLRCNEGELVTKQFCFGYTFTSAGLKTFSTILGPEAYRVTHINQLEDSEMLKCQKTMTYDYKLKMCISKACPISEVEVGGRCKSFMRKVRGTSFDYRFKLLYQMDGFTLPPNGQIFSEIRPLVLRRDQSWICIENILGVETEGKHIAVRIQLTTASDDKPYDIYEDYEAVQESVDKFNKLTERGMTDGGKLTYTVKLDNSPFEPIDGNYATLGVYSDAVSSGNGKCGSTIAISNMQFCETVVLKNYDVVEDDIIIVDGYIPFSPGEYISSNINGRKQDKNKMTVYVCYDLYVSRINDSSYMKGANLTNSACTTAFGKLFGAVSSLLYIILVI